MSNTESTTPRGTTTSDYWRDPAEQWRVRLPDGNGLAVGDETIVLVNNEHYSYIDIGEGGATFERVAPHPLDGFPLEGLETRNKIGEDLQQRNPEQEYAGAGGELCDPLDAEIVTSIIAGTRTAPEPLDDTATVLVDIFDDFDKPNDPSRHHLLVDLDVPAYLVPSSTPGHSHLYVQAGGGEGMTTEQLFNVFQALVSAGIVEPGYFSAVQARGRADLRAPWVHKPPREESESAPSQLDLAWDPRDLDMV